MIVTGSEGFIGKALCRELAKRDVEVIGLDRKSGIEATKVCELLKNGGIDCVFHLAAQTSVFNGNLEQIRKDNIDTFMRVADSCEVSIRQFVNGESGEYHFHVWNKQVFR